MYCLPTMFDGVADRLFRNNGNGTFTDVSRQAGIANPAGKGLGVTFCDFDRDGDTDVYIANDMVRNFLYRNNGDGTFLDVAYGAGVGFDGNGKPQAGMGVDCGDVDGNGLPELFVTNFSEELNTLYQNRGDGIFEDVSQKVGLGSGFGPLGFGTKLFDFDNDGDLDIHVTNGHVIDNVKLYQPHLCVRAEGPAVRERRRTLSGHLSAERSRRFRPSASAAGWPSPTSTTTGGWTSRSRASDARAVLLKNQVPKAGNWILIRAQGSKSNGFGLGATVTRGNRGRHAGERDQQRGELSQQQRHPPARRRGHRESHSPNRGPLAERRRADAQGCCRQSDPDPQGIAEPPSYRAVSD